MQFKASVIILSVDLTITYLYLLVIASKTYVLGSRFQAEVLDAHP